MHDDVNLKENQIDIEDIEFDDEKPANPDLSMENILKEDLVIVKPMVNPECPEIQENVEDSTVDMVKKPEQRSGVDILEIFEDCQLKVMMGLESSYESKNQTKIKRSRKIVVFRKSW